MHKKIILAIGILFLLAIAGCNMGKNNPQNPITDVDVRNGITGIEMEFLTNAPPEKVFAEGIIPISLKVRNSGASDIANGIVVFGLEKTFVDAATGSVDRRDGVIIKGKSAYYPGGDYIVVQLNAQTKKIGPQSETHTSTIFATTCYPYSTILGASVCIDTDITGEVTGKKACTVKDTTYSTGQGAPVAVTKVETRMLPQTDGTIRPSFMISIENVGKGEVVKPNLGVISNVCGSPALNYRDFNTLEVSAYLSGTQLDCKKNQDDSEPVEIRLKEKKAVFRCTGGSIDTSRNAYSASLKVQLNYGYTFTISKDIIIQKVLTY